MGYAPESTPTQNPSSRGHKQIRTEDTDGPVHSVLILTDYYRLGEFIQEQRLVSYASDGYKVQSQEAKLVRAFLLHHPGTERRKRKQERGGLTSIHN